MSIRCQWHPKGPVIDTTPDSFYGDKLTDRLFVEMFKMGYRVEYSGNLLCPICVKERLIIYGSLKKCSICKGDSYRNG